MHIVDIIVSNSGLKSVSFIILLKPLHLKQLVKVLTEHGIFIVGHIQSMISWIVPEQILHLLFLHRLLPTESNHWGRSAVGFKPRLLTVKIDIYRS